MPSIRIRFLKRLVDIALAALLLPLLALLWLVLRLANRSRSTVLFKAPRAGPELFHIWKLRVSETDAQLPIIGGHLARSGINELPQILNVLRGEMSLVGPRPLTPRQDKLSRERYPEWDRRYMVKPGITGLAQLQFPNRFDRSDQWLEFRGQKLKCDLQYIDQISIVGDWRLIWQTIHEMQAGHDV